jgi:hypothetical protein
MTKREGRSNNDSPASKVAKEQSMAGASSGPQEGREEPVTERQVPQTSNRRSAKHEHEKKVRKGYEASENPEKQGDGDPGPEQIGESSAMQGHAGRGNVGRGASSEDVTERSHQGLPDEGHARGGRQNVPGDRDPVQPS